MTWLLELVAVAIGVLLALWAQQWVDLRRQQRIEQAYRESLLDDLRSDLAALTGMAERLETYNAAARLVLDVVEGQASPDDDPDALLHATTTCFFVEFFHPTTTTLEELKATGHLRTLRSRELVRAVLTYHQRVAASYRMHRYILDRLWKGLWPALKEHVDPTLFPSAMAEFYQETDTHLGAPYGEPATHLKPVDPASQRAALDFSLLQGSESLRAHLLDALEIHEMLRGELRLYQHLSKEILETRVE